MESMSQLPALLLPWFQQNQRDLPWRSDKDPYHVWVSEIMLQQTRVEAVKGYYCRFINELPNVSALAGCDDDRLAKLWEGLGYYSRVRNLKKAAILICEQFNGQFPKEYTLIRSLPGIGDYTAGAICSICFDAPTPAVDGNVLRVLARINGDSRPIDRKDAKKEAADFLRPLYSSGNCGAFTQALMELGAIVCLPNGTPHCRFCPLADHCRSNPEELWRSIPSKGDKKNRRIAEKTVFLLSCEDRYAICRRPETGLLSGLWEFPNTDGFLNTDEAILWAENWGCHPSDLLRVTKKKHIFTHIEWKLLGVRMTCNAMPNCFTWVTKQELGELYSLPTAFKQFSELL